MFGGAAGALGSAAAAGGSFEYAAVLFGTLGVVMGSVIAGTIGRYLVAPMWQTMSCPAWLMIEPIGGAVQTRPSNSARMLSRG